MKKHPLMLAALFTLMPVPGAGQADPFRAVDRNGDGFVSSAEWYGQQVAPVPFTVVDLNGDGRISESEFREWSSARGGAGVRGVTSADRFRAIDRNRDGVISAEEWKDGSLAHTPFAAVDGNQDGSISLREFSAWDHRRGGPEMATPELPGTAAPSMSDRLRNLDRGAAPVPAVQPPPRAASSSAPPPAPASATLSTSPMPGAGSPNMRSGSANSMK